MKNIYAGSIPEKLTFFIRQPTKVHFRWQDVEGGGIESEVRPCFISDSSNKKTLASGLSWGTTNTYKTGSWELDKTIEPETLEVDNVPFTTIRIITLEIRDQGGRAYKVCTDIGGVKNLYFDMREDVLLDIMFNCGIGKNGVITDKFIFARVGADMKVIRVDSFLHEKMIESTEMSKAKPITDLEIGGLYRNKSGEEVVYMGKWWIREPIIEERRRYGTYGDRYYQLKEYGKASQQHVFVEHKIDWKSKKIKWFYEENDGSTWLSEYFKTGDPLGKLKVMKTHVYKEKTGHVEIPEGFIELKVKWYKEHGLEWFGRKGDGYGTANGFQFFKETDAKFVAKITSLTLEKPE